MRQRFLGIAALAAMILPGWLMTEATPLVPVGAAPTAGQVQGARLAAQRLKAMRGAPGLILLDTAGLDGVAALVSDARRGRERVALAVEDGAVVARASRALPLGLWLNVAAAFPPGTGFPDPRVTIGDLPLPAAVAGRLIRLGWPLLAWRGIRVPAPDALVRSLEVGDGWAAATVALPSESGLLRGAVGGAAVDPALVSAVYCALGGSRRRGQIWRSTRSSGARRRRPARRRTGWRATARR